MFANLIANVGKSLNSQLIKLKVSYGIRCINSTQVHSDDETNAIDYLKKAHEMAREGTTIYVCILTLCGGILTCPCIHTHVVVLLHLVCFWATVYGAIRLYQG